jgi:hypothetical protein
MLDRGIAVGLLSTMLACRHGIPPHLWIELDRQQAPALGRIIIGRLVLGPVDRGCRSARTAQLPP